MLKHRHMKSRRPSIRTAFTLLEVLIVIVVLAILAAIIVPQFADASLDAQVATLRSTVESVQRRVEYEYQALGTGDYPPAIDASWFATGAVPTHPQNVFGVPSIEVVNEPGKSHPDSKVLSAASAGAFWYNSAEGLFRARVVSRGSAAATLEFYNRVNDAAEADLGDDGGGGADPFPWS
jgi:prepilin-type N-terminal cleavage/methylation domain-containing protein